MKAGDKVREVGAERQGHPFLVIAVHGDKVWLQDRQGCNFLAPKRRYEVIPDFFEVGKQYRSRHQWNITFQKTGTPTFEPVRIDQDDRGTRVAYGKVSLDDEYEYRWIILSRYNYGSWTEVS